MISSQGACNQYTSRCWHSSIEKKAEKRFFFLSRLLLPYHVLQEHHLRSFASRDEIDDRDGCTTTRENIYARRFASLWKPHAKNIHQKRDKWILIFIFVNNEFSSLSLNIDYFISAIVFILDGNTEIGAHVRSNLPFLICLRH